MENYGRGGRAGRRGVGGRTPRGGGRGGRAGGRGQNRDQQQNDPSNRPNYQSFSGQHGYRPVGPSSSYQGQARTPISGYDRPFRQGSTSSQGQFAESTRSASAWRPAVEGSSKGAWSGSGESSGSGSGRGASGHSPSASRSSESVLDATVSSMRSLDISHLHSPESGNVVPVRRPDNGGKSSPRTVRLLANHFLLNFNPQVTLLQYNIDVEPEMPSRLGGPPRVSNSEIRSVKNKVFSDDPAQFPLSMTAYDGGKIIFSIVKLPIGKFKVDIPKGKITKSYSFTIELVKELQLRSLEDFFNGALLHSPRAVLHGLDLFMKEHPKQHRVQVGQGFYSKGYDQDGDLGGGIAAYRGFLQSLKPTAQGLSLCVDYSVLPFFKAISVLEFISEHLQVEIDWLKSNGCRNIQLRRDVEKALKGLKVTVTHRVTKQKYTIKGLTRQTANDLIFPIEDREGSNPPQNVRLVNYFRDKYNKEIEFKNLPCLDLGKNDQINAVPMEYCQLVEGQRFPKEELDFDGARTLKDMSLAKPQLRKRIILDIVKAPDGPLSGDLVHRCEIGASTEMTQLTGRVIRAPDLKLGNTSGRACKFPLRREDRQWNLVGNSVVEGKAIGRWAILDFTFTDRRFKLNYDRFIPSLVMKCNKLGMRMEKPLFIEQSDMNVLSDTDRLRKLLQSVYNRAEQQLQILVCPMTSKHAGYKALKWICETQIGIVTQCCLSNHCNASKDQYLSNLALKINAKLGGSNFELFDRLPRLEGNDHVMFIGADVNHPSPGDPSSPSAAAVVATVNWPAANKYAAQYRLQKRGSETIQEFGGMCLKLINKYAELNKVKPQKIIVFRDGVSDGQFDMVLNQELTDLRKAIEHEGYLPTITLVTAQKRHQTRLFPQDDRQGAAGGNVLPGTVVDTIIVHPWEFDFYLCSHYGLLGTSKPTHYYCLWDDHKFSSDELQQIINNLCYTYARCTKPVSLVPPAYYADNLAYRVRYYYDAWKADFASSSSSSSSSSNVLTFDPNNFKLHSDLEDKMFFT